jgi:outer membrane protein assembly factor BamB
MVLAAVLAAGLLGTERVAADQPQANSVWPQARRDALRTGRAPNNGPSTPVQRWVFNAGSAIRSGPTIGADGTVYAGTENAKLYAVKPDGEAAWSYDMPDGGGAPTYAVLTNRNRIIAGAQAGLVVGLNLDGREAWRFDTRNAPYGTSERQVLRSNPVIAPNYPNVLIGTDAGNLYELDDGAYRGIRRAEAAIRAGAAVAPDGTLIWTSLDRTLYAGVPGGGDRWRKSLDGPVSATPAIAADGTVFVATEAGTVFAVRADGSERWHTGIGGGKAVRSGPVLAADGTVYAAADDGKLYALDGGNGALKWSFTTNAPITASPTVGGNGLIYLGSTDGNLYVLRPDGQQQSRFAAGAPIDSASPAIGADGTLYVGTRGGALYALGEGGPPPATATPVPAATATPGPAAPNAPSAPATPTGPLPTDRAAPREGATYFTETGHNVGGAFLEFFAANGGLEVFGLPLTEEFEEPRPDGGATLRVQYFQRARMEHHPENAGTPYAVQLGLLGTEELRQRGWLR